MYKIDVEKNIETFFFYSDSESSSEDDGACYTESCESGNEVFSKNKKEQNNITNTRHNRAFSLRRARLDLDTNKCPNTPEMRRKFPIEQTIKNSPRSTSTDARKPAQAIDIKSRYMNLSAPKLQQSPKISNREALTKPILNNRPSSASNITNQKVLNISPASTKSASIARTDSGRFSMRSVPRTKPIVTTPKTSGKFNFIPKFNLVVPNLNYKAFFFKCCIALA